MNITIYENRLVIEPESEVGHVTFDRVEFYYKCYKTTGFDLSFYPQGDNLTYTLSCVLAETALQLAARLSNIESQEFTKPEDLLKCWLELRQQGYKPINLKG